MSRMIPPYLSDDVKSTGERQIFDLFRNDPETMDWVVLHSLTLSRHTKRLYGEIDFLVMAPKLGIFCLEVKSGRIKREEGIWKFTNRFGDVTLNPRGPFDQARECMFSLIKAIKSKFGEDSHLGRLVYGYGVMFPHINYGPNGPGEEWWQIYDRDSRRAPVSDYIKRLSRQTIKKVRNCIWFSERESLPSKKDIEELTSFMRGDFERLVSTKELMAEVDEGLVRYTEEQYTYLDQLQDNPRCLFQGAAGTGKTMMALESARRSLFDKKRVLIVCFNLLLGDWLSQQIPESRFNNLLHIGSFHQFLKKIVAVPTEREQTDDEDYFTQVLPSHALRSIELGVIEPFDKIIIDEGQDLIRPGYLDVFDSLVRGGLAGGRWEFYCDFERQAIYSDITTRDMLEMLEKRASFTRFRLNVNCRNTKPIGEETAVLSGFERLPYLCGKIEGPPVEYYFYDTDEDQLGHLENILSKLHEKQVRVEHISILSPFRWENSGIRKANCPLYKIEVGSNGQPFFMRDKTVFYTVQSFKGLENYYVILTDINRLNDPEFNRLLYIGMSRAKLGLYVLINVRAKGLFEKLMTRSLDV
jgi:hypothetical protein